MGQQGEKSVIVENLLVGVFGAFLGGDFVVSQLNGGVVDDSVFHFSSLLIAVAGATLMLGALRMMRFMVGPLRESKPPRRRD